MFGHKDVPTLKQAGQAQSMVDGRELGLAPTPAPPSQMLLRRAEQLRQQAHELETLARSLPEHMLPDSAVEVLGNLISAALYR